MNRPVLYVPIHIKNRELESKTLIALEAARRGFRVYLGRQPTIRWMATGTPKLFPPGVYFDKCLTITKEEKATRVVNAGNVMVSQDEEHGLFFEDYSRFLNIRSSKITIGAASAIFCWGYHDYAGWKKKFPEMNCDFVPTGSPRVDLWRPELARFHMDQVQQLRDKYGRFILIVSTFSWINGFDSIETRIEKKKKFEHVSHEEAVQFVHDKLKRETELYEKFLEMIREIRKEHKDLRIVIRPHTFERADPWIESLKGVENITVIHEGGLSKWIQASEFIIQTSCTSALEAFISGKLSIAYEPLGKDLDRDLPNAMSYSCPTLDDVLRAISDFTSGKRPLESFRTNYQYEKMKHIYSNFSGEFAYKQIVSKIDELKLEAHPSPSILNLRIIRRRVKSALMKWLGIQPAGTTDLKVRKFPGLSMKEMKRVHRGLVRFDPAYSDYSIKTQFQDVFVIEKK